MQATKNSHYLDFTYEEYMKNKMSLANCIISKYLIYELIGSGSFGNVYRGMNEETKCPVAVKVIDLELIKKQPTPQIKQIRRRLCATESELMLKCNHENLLKCYDVCENKHLKIMFLEYCLGGTLLQEIKDKGRIFEEQAVLILKQIINGIAQLHRNGIIHRDIKSENILIHNGVYKIADFGFSKKLQIEQNDVAPGTILGTQNTMAPQVMNHLPYGFKADIWSLGVVFYQMLSGKMLYRNYFEAQKFYKHMTSKPNFLKQMYMLHNIQPSTEVHSFLSSVLVVESRDRFGWKDLIKHPVFSLVQKRLSSQLRLSFDLDIPQGPEYDELTIEHNKGDQDLEVNKNSESSPESCKVNRLTQKAAQAKWQVRKEQEQAVYQWAKETHLQCLKTQFILEEIILPLQQRKIVNLKDRRGIEFLYMLSTRCLNNMSAINNRSKNQSEGKVLESLSEAVQLLGSSVKEKWNHYDAQLRNFENKIVERLADGYRKLFFKQFIQEKDKFLGGFEARDYTKKEQIQFTYSKYIQQLLPELNLEQEDEKVKRYLHCYKQLCAVSLSDLKHKTFREFVRYISG